MLCKLKQHFDSLSTDSPKYLLLLLDSLDSWKVVFFFFLTCFFLVSASLLLNFPPPFCSLCAWLLVHHRGGEEGLWTALISCVHLVSLKWSGSSSSYLFLNFLFSDPLSSLVVPCRTVTKRFLSSDMLESHVLPWQRLANPHHCERITLCLCIWLNLMTCCLLFPGVIANSCFTASSLFSEKSGT